MSLAHRAVRGTAYILVSAYLNMALGFITTVLLTRLLTPEAFGIFSLAVFFLGVFDLRSKLGFEYAFTQRQPTSDELLATYLALQVVFALLTVLIALLAYLPFGMLGYAVEVRNAILVLALFSLIEAAGMVPRIALEKDLSFKQTSIIISTALLAANITAVLMAFAGFGYWSLLAQAGVNAGVGAIGFWCAGRHFRIRPRFEGKIARWMLRFGRALFVGSLATLVLLQFDNFLVGTFVGVATLGFYERAYKIAQWPTGLITHVVSRSAFPTYAKLQNDRPRLSKAFGMTLWLITTLSLPLAIALFVSAPDFVELIFGPEWLPSAFFLRLLIGYSLLRPLLDDTGALFTAIGRPRLASVTLSAQAITLMITATPLTFAFGAVGTAIGVGIAFLVGIISAFRYLNQQIDISLKDILLKPVVSAVIVLIFHFAFLEYGELAALPTPVRVALKMGTAMLVYGAVLFMLDHRQLAERTKYVLRLLRHPQTISE